MMHCLFTIAIAADHSLEVRHWPENLSQPSLQNRLFLHMNFSLQTCSKPKKTSKKLWLQHLPCPVVTSSVFLTDFAMARRTRLSGLVALALAAWARHAFVAPFLSGTAPRNGDGVGVATALNAGWMEMLEEAVGTPTPETPDAKLRVEVFVFGCF